MTRLAAAYRPGFAASMAVCWDWLLPGHAASADLVGDGPANCHVAASALPDESLQNFMVQSGQQPSGRRSPRTIATRIAADPLLCGRTLPQLVPDGLRPGEHLDIGLNVVHLLLRPPPLAPSREVAMQ